MKKILRASFILVGFALSPLSHAQVSIELEEACFMDVDLTEYIVQVIDTGSSSINVMTGEEASQVASILNSEEVVNLSTSEKIKAVLTACSEGRILQTKNDRIINKLPN